MDRFNPEVKQDPLEDIAMLSMEFGRWLMECGASGAVVDEFVARVAAGLGADRADLRVGYASLAITVGRGAEVATRMCKVGSPGVNQRLDQAVRTLAQQVEQGGLGCAAVRSLLDRVVQETPRYPGWLVDLAVGAACASFGRLLGVDWRAVGPVFAAAALGQFFRRSLARRQANPFISASLVAFVGAVGGGLGARQLGSHTVAAAMTAAVLLLVPGVPALNAQSDILDGRPTLGSARIVWVAVMLVFVTAGIWLGQLLLGEGR
jgi:hypothetical protein